MDEQLRKMNQSSALPDYMIGDPSAVTLDITNALPDTPVTSMQAMQAVVSADGDLNLAAVRLRTRKANILAAIVTDPANHDTLAKYFRAHQTIRLFGLIETVTNHLEPQLDALKPGELARTLNGLLDTFARFTEHGVAPNANGAGNAVEQTLKMFPPAVQSAIRALAETEQEPELDDADKD